jgi:hypothetical protein
MGYGYLPELDDPRSSRAPTELVKRYFTLSTSTLSTSTLSTSTLSTSTLHISAPTKAGGIFEKEKIDWLAKRLVTRELRFMAGFFDQFWWGSKSGPWSRPDPHHLYKTLFSIFPKLELFILVVGDVGTDLLLGGSLNLREDLSGIARKMGIFLLGIAK